MANSNTQEDIGIHLFKLIERLYPICRSITGNGVRETLKIISEIIPLQVHEVPSGTTVFDWEIPKEWNIRDAYIKNPKGEKIVDFQELNLHVVNYSTPINKKLPLSELKKNLYSLPDRPDLVPYRTSYYNETWGFCLSDKQLQTLEEGEYEVFIDSTLENGHLSYGEFVIPGQTDDEVLLSAHTCHPSLANDNLSGISVLAHLAKELQKQNNRYTYRFIFAPGTIGSITWLALNEDKVKNIKHGMVLSCVGDAGGPTYKKSRQGNALVDRAVINVLKQDFPDSVILDFYPYGYDERNYCSPGFDLPVGLFERSQYGTFPEYHTSGDNLEFVKPQFLAESYDMVRKTIDILENDRIYINQIPKCEPQLGKRGLYNPIGGDNESAQIQMALLWVLNQSDGNHSLLDIAEKANIPFEYVKDAAKKLIGKDVLKERDYKSII